MTDIVSETIKSEIALYLNALDRTPPMSWDDPTMVDDDGDPVMMDVRLQIHDDGTWSIHTGDSSYDQGHRGMWGATVVPFEDDPDSREFDADEIAADLIEQCEEMAAQSLGDDPPMPSDDPPWCEETSAGSR